MCAPIRQRHPFLRPVLSCRSVLWMLRPFQLIPPQHSLSHDERVPIPRGVDHVSCDFAALIDEDRNQRDARVSSRYGQRRLR